MAVADLFRGLSEFDLAKDMRCRRGCAALVLGETNQLPRILTISWCRRRANGVAADVAFSTSTSSLPLSPINGCSRFFLLTAASALDFSPGRFPHRYSNGYLRAPAIGFRRPDRSEAAERARPQGRRLQRPLLHAPDGGEHPQEHLVRAGPSQVPGALLGADAVVPDGRVPGRLRVGHGGAVGGPGDVREEPGAGGDPRAVGDAGGAGVRLPGDPGEERRQVRGGGVVQGRGADLLGGRPRLPGQPQPDPRAEHPRHLGLPGGADGLRGGLPRRRRPAGRGPRRHLPRRRLRPPGPRRRPRRLRGAQGEGDQERPPCHVLHVRLLRAGHRHRQGPHREPLRPPRRPRRQQRLGLRHQLRPRQVIVSRCLPLKWWCNGT